MDQIFQRETGLKPTTTLLQRLSEYSITKEQIKVYFLYITFKEHFIINSKRTKISKVIVKISLEKAESQEEANIIKLVISFFFCGKNKIGFLKLIMVFKMERAKLLQRIGKISSKN